MSKLPTIPGDWKDASAYFADQLESGSDFDLFWRVLGSEETRVVGDLVVSREGDLELNYQDGWIQSVRGLDQLGPETGIFSYFSNSNALKPFGYYDAAVTVDPGLVFTEPMIINNPHEWWLGMINGWAAGQYSKNGSGNLVLKFPFGWQMIAGGSLYNGTPGSSNEEDGWSILTSDVTLDSSYTLPAGALRLDWFYSNYSRFWIPLATASVTAPEYVGSWPGRTRLYVLEFGFRHDEGFDINYVPRYGLGPRINMEELTTGSLVPLP